MTQRVLFAESSHRNYLSWRLYEASQRTPESCHEGIHLPAQLYIAWVSKQEDNVILMSGTKNIVEDTAH